MALRKEIEHISGATVSYWRVGGVFLDDIGKVGRIVLVGYVDTAARERERPPLDRRDCLIPKERFDEVVGTPPSPGAATLRDANATAAYNYIKALAAEFKELKPDHPLAVFADAEDV